MIEPIEETDSYGHRIKPCSVDESAVTPAVVLEVEELVPKDDIPGVLLSALVDRSVPDGRLVDVVVLLPLLLDGLEEVS